MKSQHPKKIEKLGVKIGSKEEAYWTDVRDTTKKQVEDVEKQLKFLKAIVVMADEKIALAQAGEMLEEMEEEDARLHNNQGNKAKS